MDKSLSVIFQRVERKSIFLALLLAALAVLGCNSVTPTSTLPQTTSMQPILIELPEPRLKSDTSVEEALFKRRSVREYSNVALSLEEVSQLLWAAQGITADSGGRTAPSAGGLYPLEVYLEVGNVGSLNRGVYKYRPEGHELFKIKNEDVRGRLTEAALGQAWVRDSAINIVIATVYEITTVKYGERGIRYVHMEAGHTAQNVYLQATALNLGTVTVGAFHDDQVKNILGMSADEVPLYVIPVGRKKS